MTAMGWEMVAALVAVLLQAAQVAGEWPRSVVNSSSLGVGVPTEEFYAEEEDRRRLFRSTGVDALRLHLLYPDNVHDVATQLPEETYLFFCNYYYRSGPERDGYPWRGPVIMDTLGESVWIGQDLVERHALNLDVQRFRGEDILTFFDGDMVSIGFGDGRYIGLDSSYRKVFDLTPVGHPGGDAHEFTLTHDNTALCSVYVYEWVDASDWSNVEGADNTLLLHGTFQELDVDTNELLFEWSTRGHISHYDSARPTPPESHTFPYDYAHINSLEKTPEGDYLVSLRYLHSLYLVSGKTGDIIWTLGGKQSNFTMGEGADFHFQHDARFLQYPHVISLFSNEHTERGAEGPDRPSRGIILAINYEDMTVDLVEEYTVGTRSQAEGSMQVYNDYAIAGWGWDPHFSIHDRSTGELLYHAEFGVKGILGSYRTRLRRWHGYPSESEFRISTKRIMSDGELTNDFDIYVSWNGATEIHHYELYLVANGGGDGLYAHSFNRTGFESVTRYTVPDNYRKASRLAVVVRAITFDHSSLGHTRAWNLFTNKQAKWAEHHTLAPHLIVIITVSALVGLTIIVLAAFHATSRWRYSVLNSSKTSAQMYDISGDDENQAFHDDEDDDTERYHDEDSSSLKQNYRNAERPSSSLWSRITSTPNILRGWSRLH